MKHTVWIIDFAPSVTLRAAPKCLCPPRGCSEMFGHLEDAQGALEVFDDGQDPALALSIYECELEVKRRIW